jgi:hypothetical protein
LSATVRLFTIAHCREIGPYRRRESEFLLFPSAGVVGFLRHSMSLSVNKPDERAGRFSRAPLLEVVNSEQLKCSKPASSFEVWTVRICSAIVGQAFSGSTAPNPLKEERD